MKTYAIALSTTLLLLVVPPLGAGDRKGSDSGQEEGVRTLTLVEIKGQLSYPPESKDSNPRAGSVRFGAGFGFQAFWLDWSEAPELRELAKKLDSKRVVLLGSLKPSEPGKVALGFSGIVTVRALKELSTRPKK